MERILLLVLSILIIVFWVSAIHDIKNIKQRKYVSIMQQTTTSAFGLEKHYTIIQAADGSVKRIDGTLPIGDTIIIK